MPSSFRSDHGGCNHDLRYALGIKIGNRAKSDDGLSRYASVSEIGDAENISKSYVSRILRLALLAPDIIETTVPGRTDQRMILEQLELPLPASWEEQRGWLPGGRDRLR